MNYGYLRLFILIVVRNCLTVCGLLWGGADSVWEQKKLKMRKLPEKAARPSGGHRHQVHSLLGAVHVGRRSIQAQVAGTGGATRLRNSTV